MTIVAKVGSEILVNTATANSQVNPQVTTLSNGGFVVTWQDFSQGSGDTSGSAVKAQVFDAAGVKVGSEILVNSATANDQSAQQITPLSNGGFVVAWQDFSEGSGDTSGSAVKAQVFDAVGAKIGSEILVNTATASNQLGPQMAGLSNGGFVVTWSDDSHTGGDSSDLAVKMQVFDTSGAKTGTETLVNTAVLDRQINPQIMALSNGGYVVTWEDHSQGSGGATGDNSFYAVKAQVFTAAGAKAGSEILVNTASVGFQYTQQITTLSNGGFVVTWQDGSGGSGGATGDNSGFAVKAQVFTAAGVKTGSEILVNTATADYQDNPQITALSNGGFVVTWEDESWGNGGATGDSSSTAVKAQLFNAAGSKVGSEILVNTATLFNQDTPQITALPNGRFVVTWRDGSQGNGGTTGDSDYAVKAQVFDAAGGKIGSEILVNTATANFQDNPQIAALPNGSFVVTWRDDSQSNGGATGDSSNYAIKAQVFSVSDNTIAPTITTAPEQDVAENSLVVAALMSTDPDPEGLDPAEFTITGGADAALFEIVGGNLQFKTVKDYEADPHSYEVEVTASDGVNSSSQTIEVSLTDTNDTAPVITTAATQAVTENTTLVATLTSTDADTVGSNPAAFTITGGADAALFEFVGGNLRFKTAKDYETAPHSYQVEVTASDGINSSSQTISVNLTDIPEGPVNYAKAGSEILVNTATNGNQLEPQVTALSNGRFVVTWTDSSLGNGGATGDNSSTAIKAQVLDAAGAKVGAELLVNTATASAQNAPQITALSNGGFVVTWQDHSQGIGGATGDSSAAAVKAQVFDASGIKAGLEILVNTATADYQMEPQITALSNGGFVVTWVDSSLGFDLDEVKAQVFDAAGIKIGSEILLNTASERNQTAPQITALSNGGFVVTWQDGYPGAGDTDTDVKAQVFDASGIKTGSEILVNGFGGDQTRPQITALSNGGFVVTWKDDVPGDSGRAVEAQVFDAAGAKIGSEILVNTAIASNQSGPQITALSTGGFVVTWVDDSQGVSGATGDSSGTAIKAQVFDAAGGTIGSEILVNTATANDQLGPLITALPNGGFAVTWSDLSQGSGGATGDGSQWAVKAQVFDATGGKSGSEILVNTATASFQAVSQITTLPDGSFVVTWSDLSQGVGGATGDNSGYAIKAQVFGVSSVSTGVTITGTAAANIIDATHTPGGQPFPTEHADTISGLGGNDTIHGLGGNDVIVGGAGSDTLHGDAGNDSLNGGNGNDTLYGDAGNDTLNGAAGADAMNGGDGNDLYYIDNAGDTVTDSSGVDTAYAAHDHTLGNGVERLYARSDAGLALGGNGAANVIAGRGGNDVITGGAGRDVMAGGGGADRFVFVALSDSTVGGGRDLINGFVAGTDKIDLAGIDANTGLANDQAFALIGSGAFSHTAGELQAKAFGANTLISGDVDGNGRADFHILLSGSVALQATDFLL
jgi:hypothetical protein